MTCGTLGSRVFPPQDKSRVGMIEPGLLPVRGRMAFGTITSHRGLMEIVFTMTSNTCGRRVAEFLVRQMAKIARCGFVRPEQDKVCLLMTKSLGIKLDDIELATFVFGMAGTTGRACQTAMKASSGLYIRRNFLVAGHA